MSDSLSSINVFLTTLPARWANSVELHYDAASFGSWWITAGNRKKKFRIAYDGKEDFIIVQQLADDEWRAAWSERLTDATVERARNFFLPYN